MKVAVAGTGYVGLVTGVTLAYIGHSVTCVDIDSKKIELLKSGVSPIYENELEKYMKISSERLFYTTDFKKAYENADIIFVGVGTPEREDGSANLNYVFKVIDEIISSIKKDTVVVIKSTVPIGTNDELESYCNRMLMGKEFKISIASNPEFLAQGTAVHDTLFASRIVIGVEDEKIGSVLEALYKPLTEKPFYVPILKMDRKSAEMVKYASNDFLALKISYINEVANLCEELGANIENVAKGMGYDARIGNKFLKPGIGFGGSCFPKDTKALHWLSKSIGKELKTISACIEVNKFQKVYLIKKIKEDFEDINRLNIGILGATFKPETDDLRESPCVENINILLDYDISIDVYDPVGLINLKKIFGEKIGYCKSIDDAIRDKDIVLILTEWKEIVDYPLSNYERLMKHPNIYDGRNCYDLEDVKQTNIYYCSIGRKNINERRK